MFVKYPGYEDALEKEAEATLLSDLLAFPEEKTYATIGQQITATPMSIPKAWSSNACHSRESTAFTVHLVKMNAIMHLVQAAIADYVLYYYIAPCSFRLHSQGINYGSCDVDQGYLMYLCFCI